jgi:hypothetical protein
MNMNITLREASGEFLESSGVVGEKTNISGNGVSVGKKPSVPVFAPGKPRP